MIRCKCGVWTYNSLDASRHSCTYTSQKTFEECSKKFNNTVNFGSAPKSNMLYPKPNEGKRILPSMYTKLRINWLRGSGQYQKPDTMNSGHIKATLDLLKESHKNVVDRSTDLLGKMANHFSNQPEICARLAELCILMQRVDVDDMYPIFNVIADNVEDVIEVDEDELLADWFDHRNQ